MTAFLYIRSIDISDSQDTDKQSISNDIERIGKQLLLGSDNVIGRWIGNQRPSNLCARMDTLAGITKDLKSMAAMDLSFTIVLNDALMMLQPLAELALQSTHIGSNKVGVP